MQIEIERKFELTENDYKAIVKSLIFKTIETINDIYMDTCDHKLSLNRIKFRIRNGKDELKIKSWEISSQEHSETSILSKLKDLWINYEDLEEIYRVNTKRETYTWIYKWNKYQIDIRLVRN